MKEQIKKIKEDIINREKWHNAVYEIWRVEVNGVNSGNADQTRFLNFSSSLGLIYCLNIL